jgi:beta-N-acetylhexosaminidase
MTVSLRRAAGSLLVVGLGGAELTALERAWLKLVRPGGLILFRRNIVDAGQTRALLAEASAFGPKHGLRCVDVEGGTVDRLRDALAPMPSAQAVARASLRSISSRNAKKNAAAVESSLPNKHGRLVGQSVRAFGFNTTLAPVLDLGLADSAAVMGTRTAGATPADVVEYARAFLSGLSAAGVAGCGKHFPGLGGGTRDSHLETPAIQRRIPELWREDLVPYRELRTELPMVMVNHAAYPETPGKDQPASVSRYWIATVLRRQIGYDGIVFSDDLEMGGILKFMSIEEAVVASVRAGMDLMEICHSPELILRAYEALIAEAERSLTFRRTLSARAMRTVRLRAKLFQSQSSRPPSAQQFEALRKRILGFSEKVAKAQGIPEEQTA